MNAFIRQKYARYPFGRFTDSNRTDVLALSILPHQKPFNWWTQRFINNDSRRYFSDQPVEVLYHCQETTTHTHTHYFLTMNFPATKKTISLFSPPCLLLNWNSKSNKRTDLPVIFVMMQPTLNKRNNRKYDFYDLYVKPEWVPVMNEWMNEWTNCRV